MRIAMIGLSLYGQGAEFVLATIAKGLAARGHSLDVIVSRLHDDIRRAHPDWKPFNIGEKVRMIVMGGRRGRQCIGELRKIFRTGCYDIVVCHASPFAIPARMAALGMVKSPRFVYVEHLGGIGTDWNGNFIQPGFSVLKALKNLLMRLYDAQFAVSQGTLDAINRVTGYPKSRLHLVYNPVFDETFENRVTPPPEHPWLRLATEPVIVAAGAFNGVKNFELLIEAFAEVRKSRKCRLIIFGEGRSRTKYEALIAAKGIQQFVSLPGFTNKLRAELKGASCFVVSSTVESFSIVLVEAMAAGVPVISTDAPYGPREILQGGKNGILVPNRDRGALVKAINKVLDGNGIPPSKDMIARFSVESASAAYERELLNVLKGYV